MIIYRQPHRSEWATVHTFLCDLGWAKRLQDRSRFDRMMEAGDRHVAAFDGDRLVGFARALCDGVSNGYLSMVAVHPDYRGQGIGRRLVEEVIGDDPRITWVLRAGRGSGAFWRRLEFKQSRIAMERVRTDEGK